MRKFRRLGTILGLALLAIMLIAMPALAAVEQFWGCYKGDVTTRDITKVEDTFCIDSYSGNGNCRWAAEADYSNVAEMVVSYYPSKSDTGWIIGIATNAVLRKYTKAYVGKSYNCRMEITSPGQVYFRVTEGGVVKLEWSGAAQSSTKTEFGICCTSNEVLAYGTTGDLDASVVRLFTRVYDNITQSWLWSRNVYSATWQGYREQTFYNGVIGIDRTPWNNFYMDTCSVSIDN